MMGSLFWGGWGLGGSVRCLLSIRYLQMCDVCEVAEGTLDALPQLLCPADAPSHGGHVLVHRRESWRQE